jgi:hypothetical protein
MSAPVSHVDAEALAEFRAGLITGRSGARIAAHLAECDRCTALDDQLAGISVLLASVPAPVLPDRVAQRLDTVLAAEVAGRNDAERAGREPSPEPRTSSRRAGHRRFRLPSLRVLAPVAAAAAVVLAGGGYALSLIAGGPGSQVTASSAGGAQSVAGGANRIANRAAAPVASSSHGGASIRSRRNSPASVTVVTSGTNFQATGLAQQLETALKTAPAGGQQASARVAACVREVAGSASPVQVLLARYQGQPATIIVARTGSHDTAWVAGSSCRVMATRSLPSGI